MPIKKYCIYLTSRLHNFKYAYLWIDLGYFFSD